MIRSFVLLVLLPAFFVHLSCRKSVSAKPVSYSLIGNWRWVRQTDSIRDNGELYDTLTPLSTGLDKWLAMNEDSTWSLTQNGLLAQIGDFTLVKVSNPGGGTGYLLNFQRNRTDSTVVYGLSSDTLYTTTNIDDNGKYIKDIYARTPSMPD